MRKTQQGFTLIELIMVIVIIGILASVALPRFYDMQGDARSAKAEAIYGSVRSASAIAHSAALVKGLTSGTITGSCVAGANALCMEGTPIDLLNGYPSNTGSGIAAAASLVDGQDGVSFTNGDPITIAIDGGTTCEVTYKAATATASPEIKLFNNKQNNGSC